MRPAPTPAEWKAPLEDTSLTAWLGTDGRWHLCVDATGWHPYVTTTCGADLHPGVEEGANWSTDTDRVDCPDCTASDWHAVATMPHDDDHGQA
jgi:hypothetical protein